MYLYLTKSINTYLQAHWIALMNKLCWSATAFYRSAAAIFGAVWMSGRACQLKPITIGATFFFKQLQTILYLTWGASLESTFQIFSKPFSHCPSQRWHFRQCDEKDVMSVAFQVIVTVVSTSSVNFTLLTITHLKPCHK